MTVVVILLMALAAPAPRENPWIEPAREVLVQACGSCHRPNLPTSNPGALAVFDLHEPAWYGSMSDDQLRELRRRIAESSNTEEPDRKLVIAFVDCKLDGACSAGPEAKSP